MRLLILTACTGKKVVTSPDGLTARDFDAGPRQVGRREEELADVLAPAEELYAGQQHVRLLRGVRAFREAANGNGRAAVDLWILSAGYGLVPASRRLAPYERTFQGMPKGELRRLAQSLGVPHDLKRLLAEPYDAGLILLGDDYLAAAQLDDSLRLGGPTWIFCGKSSARRLPEVAHLHPLVLGVDDARRFRCGLVGLKGEVAARWLEHWADHPAKIGSPPDAGFFTVRWPSEAVDAACSAIATASEGHRTERRPAHGERRLAYFIPDWDDLVDPHYDFQADRHSFDVADWSNQVYAHQMYPAPNYDGVLVSRIVAENTLKKKERINRLGVRRYLRLPEGFPVMGDCGAFGYIDEEAPPYTTAETIGYYTRLGFTYGVSVDHLIVTPGDERARFRYDLTLRNAEEFLQRHRRRRLPWTPIGAVQGWDPESYSRAALAYVEMGYACLALGGLVRTNTSKILEIVAAVREAIPEETKLHLFGVARLEAVADYVRLGVDSVDSASYLRKAWLGAERNYASPDGWYAALRIPLSRRTFRAKRLVRDGTISQADLEKLERACLSGVRRFAAGGRPGPTKSLLDRLVEYDALIAGPRDKTRSLLERTLTQRPWRRCGCAICRRWGVEVVIFRGNNRNRRRGFHNTHVFYRQFRRGSADAPFQNGDVVHSNDC